MIKDLIKKSRSYRRFYENVRLDMVTLKELVELARLSPSTANLQSLKYVLSNSSEKNDIIFNTLGWAGYFTDWAGPEEGERPAAYIVILNDSSVKKEASTDSGIAAQSILLGAAEKGFGGCMLGNVNRKQLKKELNLEEKYEIVLVVALGKPKEEVMIEEMKEGNVKYWRDENGIHHVPKRKLEDIIVE